MATTFSWRVKNIKSDPNDDNYITEANVEVYGTEDSVVKMEPQSCIFTGNKDAVGSNFLPYSTLIDSDKAFTETGEETIIGWVKNRFLDYEIAMIENRIQAQIDLHNKKILEVETVPTSTIAKPTVTITPS